MTRLVRITRAAGKASFDAGSGIIDGRAVAYNIVDDYRSVFLPGCFDASLRDPAIGLPSLCLAHDWADVVGRITSWESRSDGLYVVGQLDDPTAVPSAAKAWAQARSGSVSDLSVGFHVPTGGRRDPTPDELQRWPGAVEIIERAILDEVSLVLRGAVPGAKVLATRTATAPAIGGHRRRPDWNVKGALEAEIDRRRALRRRNGGR